MLANHRVSMIVISFNGEDVIGDCLKSLTSLHSPEFEILVIDNASKDETKREASRIAPSARVVPLTANKGYGGGANVGAQVANGEFLFFMNQDVRLSPSFVDSVLHKMKSDDRVGMCGGVILNWQGDRVVSAGQLLEKWTGYALDYGFGSTLLDIRMKNEDAFSVNGAVFAIRRDVFEKIGGFAEDLFMYFDETDLAWRTHIAGYRVVCCSDAIAFHRISPGRAHNPYSRFYIERNSLLSALWNYELQTLLVSLPISFVLRATAILALIAMSRYDQARSIARALYEVVNGIPRARQRRRQVASIRRLKDREIMKSDLLAKPSDVLRVFLSSFLPSTSSGPQGE